MPLYARQRRFDGSEVVQSPRCDGSLTRRQDKRRNRPLLAVATTPHGRDGLTYLYVRSTNTGMTDDQTTNHLIYQIIASCVPFAVECGRAESMLPVGGKASKGEREGEGLPAWRRVSRRFCRPNKVARFRHRSSAGKATDRR
jgi:hypothetical protein